MEYIAGNTNFKLKNSAVTLGKFDGLHLGHQLLINMVINYKMQGYQAVMFSFLYHPSNLFSDKELELIYTEEEKMNRLKKSGLDALISYPFTEEVRSMDPELFIKEILVDKIDAKMIVVGSDFRFGYMRQGDTDLLIANEKKYGYKVIVCDKKKWKDTIISSSAIRLHLKQGHMEMVNAMLGTPFSIRGEVLNGRKLGRTIGIPTINLLPASNKLLPPCGVYASRTVIDGKSYPSVTNIGYKPTVADDEAKGVETYIFDYNKNLYGEIVEVELLTYQRPEVKFASIEELTERMQFDIQTTRDYFRRMDS